ncbi:hypothetical protein TEA_026191 [Camellia sinensis var. sinensis]|uniref:Uncharacterized protein n=1 Tax=Camellia sinensis var. sinensis TaxID=542762 RepID=A0A4S4F1B0_CAMSN|nr:hypothetical protein TEA_026191 [Camellia sinensis var. sinensis]
MVEIHLGLTDVVDRAKRSFFKTSVKGKKGRRTRGYPVRVNPLVSLNLISKMLKPDKWQATFDSDGKVFGFQKALKSIILGKCASTANKLLSLKDDMIQYEYGKRILLTLSKVQVALKELATFLVGKCKDEATTSGLSGALPPHTVGYGYRRIPKNHCLTDLDKGDNLQVSDFSGDHDCEVPEDWDLGDLNEFFDALCKVEVTPRKWG